MSRAELMDALLARSIENPERLASELSEEAIAGAIRWYDHRRFKLGESVGEGLLAWKLREGGFAGFGSMDEEVEAKVSVATNAWYRTGEGRERWVEANVSDLEPDEAEAAVITLAGENLEVTPELVRERVQQSAQMDADFYAAKGEFEGKSEPSKSGGPWISFVGRKR